MPKRHLFLTSTLVLLLFLSACHLVGVAPSDAAPAADQATLIALAVQQTQTAAAPVIPQPSNTSEVGTIPITVTVSVQTNCRAGPGTVYEALGFLSPGETAEVVGRSHNSDNWIIKLPSNPAITCWLWGYYATVTGDTSTLPVYTPPPTPTPAADYTISYVSTLQCVPFHVFRFQLVNTGSVTWSSYQLTVHDITLDKTATYMANDFKQYDGCVGPLITLIDLTPGESGITGNWIGGALQDNPVGHSVTATFKLCPQDGLGGQCLEKSITFTP